MIRIEEVKTKKQQKEFLNFPLKLYRDNPYFVPPLYGDEKKIFSPKYVYNDTCDSVFFLAYKDGKPAGRISGIIQRASNEKTGEKRCRFTRFDAIDDRDVSAALFAALEDWAAKHGMDTICGPLGYSDLEREGLLIEGFERLATFEEQYNAEYYQHHIESLGYQKEVDWFESMLRAPEEDDGTLKKMADYVMQRYRLHFGPAKNVNDFLKKYADGFFELLDKGYEHIYGTVPFTDGMKKMMIANFKLIIDLKYVAVILDENDRLVCLGLCFPSIAAAVQKSGGHLTPAAIVRLLCAIRHPSVLDLGLIAVAPEYLNRGVSAVIAAELVRMLKEDGVEYAETNLNLEDNYAIRNMWKRLDEVVHKKRRSYIKKLGRGDK